MQQSALSSYGLHSISSPIGRLFAALTLIAVFAFQLGCGGSGSGNTTTTTVEASATDVSSGTAIQFTATIAPAGATGTVSFNEGSTILGTAPLGSGKSSVTISTFTPGTHSITATYNGDSLFSASTSKAVTVTIGAASGAPAITTQPLPATVTAGSSVTFTVVASGSSLTYQWLKNGSPIGGAITASYTIASVVKADAGNYSVVVTNTSGSITSTVAALTVN